MEAMSQEKKLQCAALLLGSCKLDVVTRITFLLYLELEVAAATTTFSRNETCGLFFQDSLLLQSLWYACLIGSLAYSCSMCEEG